MDFVKCFNLPMVLKHLSSGSKMTLLSPLTVGNSSISSPYYPPSALNNVVIVCETVDVQQLLMSVLPHVTVVCKSSFFDLRIFSRFASFFLTYDACKILIHPFVTSRIDHCNSLLYGQPKCILHRPQCP